MWTTPPLPLTLSLFKTHEQGDSRHLSKFAVSNSESICWQCVCFLSLWTSFQTNPDVPQSPPHQVSTWGNCRVELMATPPPLVLTGFPGGSVGKNPPANAGDTEDAGSISGLGDPLEEEWHPAPVFLPRHFHGQRSLEGYRRSQGSQRVRQDWACINISPQNHVAL